MVPHLIVAGNESVTAFYTTLGHNVEERVSMGRKIVENIPSTPA